MGEKYETIFMKATETRARHQKVRLEAGPDESFCVVVVSDGDMATGFLSRADLIEMRDAINAELE